MIGGKAKIFYLKLSLFALLLLLFLFIIPLSMTLSRALTSAGDVFSSAYTYRVLSFTLFESFLSALISVLLSLPFAYFWSHQKFFMRSFVLSLSTLSFTIPSILVVLGFVIFYGRSGVLSDVLSQLLGREVKVKVLYSFFAIIFAHVYLNLPVAFNLIANGWEKIDPIYEESSYSLGRGKMRTFISVTLPMLKKEILSAFILIFFFCFTSFSIVLVLGGSPKFSTLEVEIYRRVHVSLELDEASAFALFNFLVTLVILLVSGKIGRMGREKRMAGGMAKLEKLEGKKKLVAIALVLLMLLFILPPLLSIPYRSLVDRNGKFSLSSWEKIFSRSQMSVSIVNSLLIALSAALFSAYLGETLALFSARTGSRIVPLFATLPLATGSATLGLGMNIVQRSLMPQSLVASYLMVTLMHLMITIPFSIRTILPGAALLGEEKTLSSYTLGKSYFTTFASIEHPLLSSYRRKAFLFAFALSLGEVNATMTLSSGKVTTLPVLLYNLIGSYDYQGASALGTVLLLLAFMVFFILGAGRKGKADVT